MIKSPRVNVTTPVATYREASHELLAQARTELAAGDLRQAGEKGWGAAAQIVKACAEHRGWPHGSHRYLFTTVNALVMETDDREIHDLFAAANYLHSNFYEHTFDAVLIARDLDHIDRFIDKLEPLLDA